MTHIKEEKQNKWKTIKGTCMVCLFLMLCLCLILFHVMVNVHIACMEHTRITFSGLGGYKGFILGSMLLMCSLDKSELSYAFR